MKWDHSDTSKEGYPVDKWEKEFDADHCGLGAFREPSPRPESFFGSPFFPEDYGYYQPYESKKSYDPSCLTYSSYISKIDNQEYATDCADNLEYLIHHPFDESQNQLLHRRKGAINRASLPSSIISSVYR